MVSEKNPLIFILTERYSEVNLKDLVEIGKVICLRSLLLDIGLAE